MLRFGILNLIAGLLQLSVPSYGFRLLRRFGPQRVGWFMVISFAALGLAHLLEPIKPASLGPHSGWMLDGMYAVASALLLIGMGHLETLISERSRAQKQQEDLRVDWESRVEKKITDRGNLVKEIARRTQINQRLEDSEAQYRFLFENNPDPMLIVDLRSLRFLAVNNAALELYGLTPGELSNLTVHALMQPECTSAFEQDLLKPCSGVQFRGQWHHLKRDQMPIQVEVSAIDLKYFGCPARLLVVADMGLRYQRELKICQAQKMEVIAQLADRFAHQFNNILSIIDSQADLLLDQPLAPVNAEQLKRISEASKRAAALTSQLLATGGRQGIHMEPLDLNIAIQELDPMLRRLVGESIRLELSFGPNLPAILADARVIEHIIVHLVNNSRRAMVSGTISIRTSAGRFDTIQSHECSPFQDRECVVLCVKDTGHGMSPEVQAHLFEPFFTTHDGNAAGLGLASIYGAVKQHSGWIEVSSEVGAGTEFRIFFPVAPHSAVVPQKNSKFSTPTPARGTIMLVQGKSKERELTRYVLSRNGYRIIEADCATTAVLLFESQAKNISLLVIDLRLPEGIPGPKLATRLLKDRPNLKVLYLADSGPEADGKDAICTDGLTLIPKPYGPERLLVAVQGCLARDC
jgi:PAS domain S-box-containing protein